MTFSNQPPKLEQWSAKKIQDYFKDGKLPVVLFRDQTYKPLHVHGASKLSGTYKVSISNYEIVVFTDSRKEEPK